MTPAQMIQADFQQAAGDGLATLCQREKALEAACADWREKLKLASDAIQDGMDAQKRLNTACLNMAAIRKDKQRARYLEFVNNPVADLRGLSEGALLDWLTEHEVTGALQFLVEDILPARREHEAVVRVGLTECQADLAKLRAEKAALELAQAVEPIVREQGPLGLKSPRVDALNQAYADATEEHARARKRLIDLRSANHEAQLARASVGTVTTSNYPPFLRTQ